LRFQVVRAWRDDGRWDFSDSELEAEITRRADAIRDRMDAHEQMMLPLDDVSQVSLETKRAACKAGRNARIQRRAAVLEALKTAGPVGMSRGELAAELGVDPGSVSAAVKYLLDQGQIFQPRKKMGPNGVEVAVLVHADHMRGAHDE
jgi:hypothetical protein